MASREIKLKKVTKRDKSAVNKQTGKVVVVPVVSNSTGAPLKYRDNGTYQVKGHGDYVQENGG